MASPCGSAIFLCDPNGIRTRAAAVKGRCPRPLDDGVMSQASVVHSLNPVLL